MRKVDTLIHAKWIVPVVPENTVWQDHSLVIDDGKIIDILETSQASEQFEAVHVHTLPHHALLPGLVNAHTHTSMNLFRGLADDLPLMTWLEDHIWPAENKWVSQDFINVGSRLAFADMIRSGTTCCNDMYFFPEITGRIAAEIGLRMACGIVVFDFPCAWGSGADDYLAKGKRLHDEFLDHELISTCLAPHAPYTVSDENLTKVKQAAHDWQSTICMHVHETIHEVNRSLDSHNMRPLQRLSELGLLDEHFVAVHMTAVNDEDIELCQAKGLHVVTCPESNLKLASGFCPVQKFLDASINVSVGTDGAASNNDLDMWSELRTTALLAKAIADDTTACDAPTTLKMATLNGAQAMGISDKIGSIAIGKEADIISVDFDILEAKPLYHIISQLVYASNRQQVQDVWIRGKQVMANRQLLTLDEATLFEQAHHWQEKIKSFA